MRPGMTAQLNSMSCRNFVKEYRDGLYNQQRQNN